jgi:hypothetical protein
MIRPVYRPIHFVIDWRLSFQPCGVIYQFGREIVKSRVRIIDDILRWERFLHARNLSPHDYLGISVRDFLEAMSDFDCALTELRALNKGAT